MEKHWAIIADDFTGAGDSAVQFGSADNPVRLLFDGAHASLQHSDRRTIVVDTETRFLGPEEAYARVASVTRDLIRAGSKNFFKKIDSTLRGNPAEEIAAIMDIAGYRYAVVAPSAPLNKRTVVGGICYVDGTQLSATPIAEDPFTPVNESRISRVLDRRFPGAVRELELKLVRSGREGLDAGIAKGLSEGARVFVADAETLTDLLAIASISARKEILFAGSSGLAEAVAKKNMAAMQSADFPLPLFPHRKALFVNGSMTTTSNDQCDYMSRFGNVSVITLNTRSVLSDPVGERKRLLGIMVKAPPANSMLIRTSMLRCIGNSVPSMKTAGLMISSFLGELVREAMRDRNIEFIFISGGDTAARIMKMLGAENIDFISEVSPGLPFGYFHSSSLKRTIFFSSKSGGFGDEDAMAKILSLIADTGIGLEKE